MKSTFIAIVLAALVAFACAQSSTDCPNALIAASGQLNDVPWQFVESTAANTVCPRLNNLPSCCPPTVIAAAEEAFGRARAEVLIAQDRVRQVQDEAEQISDEFDSLRKNLTKLHKDGKIPDPLYNAFMNLIDNVEEAILTFLDDGLNSFNKCLESLLTYLAGLVCFACDVTWKNYVIIVGNSYTLILDQSTCDSLNGGCISFYAALVAYVNGIVSAQQQFLNEIGIPIVIGDIDAPCNTTGNFSDGSAQSCKNLICNTLFRGAEFDIDNVISARSAQLSNLDMENKEYVSMLNDLNERIATLTSHKVDRVLSNRRAAFGAVRRAVTQNTVYNSTGYPLYAVGEESSLDKSVSSASSLGVSALLLVVVSLLAFLF